VRRYSLVLICLLYLCCNNPTKSISNKEGRVIAEVYGESLMDYEIKSLIPSTANTEDSINISNAYLEQWIRESLILHEAKKDAPPDIDKLIENYRSSLLKVHFENKIIESNLDSTISETELNEFYQAHKSEYLLKEKATKLFILRISDSSSLLDNFKTQWDKEDLKAMSAQAKSSNEEVYFEEDKWYRISDLSKFLSRAIVRRIENNEGNRFSTTENGFKYFIKVIEIKSKNDIPPFSVVDNQLRKVILHQRKKKILNQYTEDLYEREARKKSIKTYIES